MWVHTGVFAVYGILFLISRGFFSKTGAYLAGKLPEFLALTKKQIRMVLILVFSFNCLGFFVTLAGLMGNDTLSEGYLVRREKGGGSYQEELVVSDGEKQENIVVEILEEPYTEAEIIQMLDEVLGSLDEEILGENDTFDRIEYPLNLMTTVDGTPVTIDWNTSQPIYLDWEGTLGEEIPAEGAELEIRAQLSVDGINVLRSQDGAELQNKTEIIDESVTAYTREYKRTVRVYPEKKSEAESFVRDVGNAVDQLKQQKGAYQYLPQELDGKALSWSRPTDLTGVWFVFFGILIGTLLILSQKSRKEQREKDLRRQMLLDYPGIIQKLVLLMRAGVSCRRAIRKLALDYKCDLEQGKAHRRAYEEILRIYYEMEQGIPEEEAYYHLGLRCEIPEYRTLSTLLIQNLKKGSGQFFPMMEQECVQAFEARKKHALVLGEEAGTKLLGPMMVMLLIVLLILIVPSFLSI